MNGASDFSLDNRLALCADFVRDGAKVADIGTDHAYLPVWLCRIGRCDTAIAADINPLPLERGIETINNSGLNNRIEARLSNGLEKISGDEADDIVIAGMGGVRNSSFFSTDYNGICYAVRKMLLKTG